MSIKSINARVRGKIRQKDHNSPKLKLKYSTIVTQLKKVKTVTAPSSSGSGSGSGSVTQVSNAIQ